MKISASPTHLPQRRLPQPVPAQDRLILGSSGPALLRRQNLLALFGGPQPHIDRVGIQTAFLAQLRQHGLAISGLQEARNALESGFCVHFQGDVAALREDYRQAVAQGVLTQAQADASLARLKTGPLERNLSLALCSDAGLAARLSAETVLATAGPIEALAAAAGGPQRVIGLRFPAAAERARVVEVVPGPQTSPETLAKTLAYVRAVGKSPLVVRDSPGLVLERISLTVINQGVRLFDELKGGDPQRDQLLATQIDQVALETFWPKALKKAPDELRGRALTPLKAVSGASRAGLAQAAEALHQRFGAGYTLSASFQGGAPLPLGHPVEVPEPLRRRIEERLQGAVIGVAAQLVEEGVARPEDIERGLKAGLDWEVGPLDWVQQMGERRALKVVRQLGPGFETALANSKPHFVDSRQEGSTAYITLNKPQRGNALDPNMLEELAAAVKLADNEPSVRHIVLESSFNRQFTQGADLNWVNQAAKSFEKESWLVGVANLFGFAIPPFKMLGQYWTFRNVPKPYFNQGLASMAAIAQTSKPTIAKIEGHALGGGLELGLACDYIVASEGANLGLPEVHHGIFPAWGGTERLPQRIGQPLARWMILEGGYFHAGGSGPSMLTGREACDLGLVDRVASADKLDEAVQQLIQSGQADHKPQRDPDSRDLSATRFEALRQRYATASNQELLQNELAGLYDGDPRLRAVMTDVVELADQRIRAGLQAHPEADLLRSMRNSLKVSRFRP